MTAAPAPAPAPSPAKHGYSSYQIALHWTVVGLVAFQWLLGRPMERAYEGLQAGEVVARLGGAYSHVALGVAILIVMLARLAAKIARPVQVAPDSPHRILAVLGRINHWAFYVILIALPIGGLLAWFGGSEGAARAHALLASVLPFLIAIHVAAALFHQFVLRDGLIDRIVRGTGGT